MSVATKPPRLTHLSWAEVREILDLHQEALKQLFGNSDALKNAIGGEIVDDKLVSRSLVASQAMLSLSFWGRLKWLLTGSVV